MFITANPLRISKEGSLDLRGKSFVALSLGLHGGLKNPQFDCFCQFHFEYEHTI